MKSRIFTNGIADKGFPESVGEEGLGGIHFVPDIGKKPHNRLDRSGQKRAVERWRVFEKIDSTEFAYGAHGPIDDLVADGVACHISLQMVDHFWIQADGYERRVDDMLAKVLDILD